MFLASFSLMDQNNSSLLAECFRKLVEKTMFAPKEEIGGIVLKKKLLKISYNEQNPLGFKRISFLKIVKTALPKSCRKVWWWLYLWKIFLHHFRTLSECDRDFCLNIFLSLGLSRLHSMCSNEHFELKNDLSIISGGWPK